MPRPNYSNALLVDLYELTMAQVAWRHGMDETATFSLFFRGQPKDRGFYAVAGIETALSHLESVHFNDDEIDYLTSTSMFDSGFIEFLRSFRFTGSVRAMPEGSVAFGDEPVLEITAPFIEGQVVETALLNAVTFPTSVLTKAVRIVQAADGRPVVEFGARRAQAPDTADIAARCASIAGFSGTSNLKAAAQFGLPIAGTMAHSFVQSFETELQAFRAYAAEFPTGTTLLVDTYDTVQGVRNAITVGLEMKAQGERLKAVRLDSGDLLSLAVQTRKMLNDADLPAVQIIATGGLDEHSIAKLVSEGAPIDGFGVGTRYAVSADSPYADSVYKLVEYAGQATRKYSPGKETLPGPKQVFRHVQNGKFSADMIGTADDSPAPDSAPLLQQVMENGKRVGEPGTTETAAARLREQLEMLPGGVKRLKDPDLYPVTLTPALEKLRDRHAVGNADN